MQALVIIEAQGKVTTWQRVLASIGMKARVVATHGHIARFPDRLTPLGIDLRQGASCDRGRIVDPRQLQSLLAEVALVTANAPIFIATDDDAEGDVIALDIIEGLIAADSRLAQRLFRVRLHALSSDGITVALNAAAPVRETATDILARALPGRARAVTDRWIGAVFSRHANHPVGRVRSAILGAFLLLDRAPHLLRGRPETGEIILRCRARNGGPAFLSHIRLDGTQDPERVAQLIDLAQRFKGRMVPGMVCPRTSLSAAVSPRIGTVRPFNTGDAIAYAARHFNLGARQAMKGLQDAYMDGLISYPRTDARSLSRESAVRVLRIADACRMPGGSVSALCGDDQTDLAAEIMAGPRPRRPHEALHPICDITRDRIARLETIFRAPVAFRDHSGASRADIMEIMAALVGRRAIEASRPITLAVGDWRPDNRAAVQPADARLLEGIDWVREEPGALPWSKDMMTGARQWPLRAIVIDMMMSEGIGRPSTIAAHADTAEASGEIALGDPADIPRPTPFGRKVLGSIPKGLWNPATCRLIEAALANQDNICDEHVHDTLQARLRHRIAFWFTRLPQDMQTMLLDGLDDEQGARDKAVSVAPSVNLTQVDPCAIPVTNDLPTPSPIPS